MTPMTAPGHHPRFSRSVAFAALLGYSAWLVFPMVWVAYSSLKPDDAIFRDTFALPSASDLRTDNYARAWSGAHFGGYFVNSVVVTGASVALIVSLGAMAAYALARFSHPAGRVVFGLMMAGLTIPAQLAVVPLFFELRSLGLLNSRTGLVLVYTANGLPFAIFILAGFFRSLPRSLYEAAVVDGCGEFSAFWRVLLPLARPGLVTVAIFQFIGVWREYFYAFMLVNGDTAQAAPGRFRSGSPTSRSPPSTGPSTGCFSPESSWSRSRSSAVYLALQRQIVRGIAAGALKG